jgi:hypothetical protein
MYIQNRHDRSKYKAYSPFQNYKGLICLNNTIAYFAFTNRCVALEYKRTFST